MFCLNSVFPSHCMPSIQIHRKKWKKGRCPVQTPFFHLMACLRSKFVEKNEKRGNVLFKLRFPILVHLGSVKLGAKCFNLYECSSVGEKFYIIKFKTTKNPGSILSALDFCFKKYSGIFFSFLYFLKKDFGFFLLSFSLFVQFQRSIWTDFDENFNFDLSTADMTKNRNLFLNRTKNESITKLFSIGWKKVPVVTEKERVDGAFSCSGTAAFFCTVGCVEAWWRTLVAATNYAWNWACFSPFVVLFQL